MSTRPSSVGRAGRTGGEPENSWRNGKGQILPKWLDSFGGISCYGLFELAKSTWIDPRKPPGYTSQTKVLGLQNTLRVVTRLQYFLWSPNLIWFAMALSMHVFFPYDIKAAEKGFALDWALKRFAVNYAVAFAYYGFFYVGLYMGDWAKRKYNPGVYPDFGNMMHNLYYWSLAIVQWTMWECVMMRLWATKKVPYLADEDLFSSSSFTIAWNVAWVLAIPLWRDLHFYIAHRFIHIRAIYKYVHSLHHRNADPEPFSGMTMHPVEHLYYFSNAFTPSLYAAGMFTLSPFIFQWNFMHLTIAPGAGHSGWEDHFQADQYHYLHHAKFECNYGSPLSAPIDQALGTFREKLGDSDQYTGEWGEEKVRETANAESTPPKKGIWSPDGYLGLPKTWDHGVYTLFWAAIMYLGVWAVTTPNKIADLKFGGKEYSATEVISLVVTTSPPFVAMLLAKLSGDRMSWRWPFHKEQIVGVFGLFWLLGYFACIMPVYHAMRWVLEPQQAPIGYCPFKVFGPMTGSTLCPFAN